MPSIPLYPRPNNPSPADELFSTSSPLPTVLQTPSGLAILELQGTINFPMPTGSDNADEAAESDNNTTLSPEDDTTTVETPIGNVVFPDYVKSAIAGRNNDDKKWMKRVYLYVGRYQRMTGEVKELTNPIAIIRKRHKSMDTEEKDGDATMTDDVDSASVEPRDNVADGLEVVDIVRYKLLFKNRPEPVNDAGSVREREREREKERNR